MLQLEKASPELSAGYREAERLARERAATEPVGSKERKEWERLAEYCRVMADNQLVEAPESRVNWYYLDDAIGQKERITRELSGVEEAPDPLAGLKELTVNVGVAMLTDRQNLVATSFYKEMASRKQIAKRGGMAAPTVDVHLREARRRWRSVVAAADVLA